MTGRIIHGDCLDVLAGMGDASFDAVVTDPPYSWAFMGAEWDDHASPREFQAWCESWAKQLLRVLKPGGHALLFGGPRSYHRLACGLEDAGFELRDSIIAWTFAQGFPKSLDISKAIDKAAGCEREVIGVRRYADGSEGHWATSDTYAQDSHTKSLADGRAIKVDSAPASELGQRFDGYGTSLKPAYEPVILARRPLAGTVAQNVERWGVGGINVDGCRIEGGERPHIQNAGRADLAACYGAGKFGSVNLGTTTQGRWPTNMVLCHSPNCQEGRCVEDCHVAEMDRQSGDRKASGVYEGDGSRRPGDSVTGWKEDVHHPVVMYADSGGASRFYPCFRFEAKADSSERMAGPDGTKHVTVKPVDLMRWLIRLVSPPDGGRILDPFAGSGSTLVAAFMEDVECVGIEKDARYVPIIEKRLEQAKGRGAQTSLFGIGR